MTRHAGIKAAARRRAARDGVSYTKALYAERTESADAAFPHVEIDQRIRFDGDRTSMTVQAISSSGRYVALTRPDNLRGSTTYTVIDFIQGIRGTATSWGVGFETPEECVEALDAFEAGASEVSYRNWVWLRYTDSQPDSRTQDNLAHLRLPMAFASVRRRNDRTPRTREERLAVVHAAVRADPGLTKAWAARAWAAHLRDEIERADSTSPYDGEVLARAALTPAETPAPGDAR